MPSLSVRLAVAVALLATAGAGCGSTERSGRPSVVVTHSILGDVVRNVVGDQADVDVVMPAGADPHEFEPSAAQAGLVESADLVVVNGFGLEVGLLDVLDAAASSGVEVLDLGAVGDDPHWFTDPVRMADAVALVAGAVEGLDGVDRARVEENAAAYERDVRAVVEEIDDELAAIPADDRVLLTNHEVFGAFADRFDFEVVGTVIPTGTTLAEPSGQDLADLVGTIEEADLPAIFVDASSSSELADVLVEETGEQVEVVELFSESLGDEGSGGETYLELLRTNAARIHAALT